MLNLQITDSQKYAEIIPQDDKTLYVSYSESFYTSDVNGFLIHINSLVNVNLHHSIKLPKNSKSWYEKNAKCKSIIDSIKPHVKINDPQSLISFSEVYFSLSAMITEQAKTTPLVKSVETVLRNKVSDKLNDHEVFQHITSNNQTKYCAALIQLWAADLPINEICDALGETFNPKVKIENLLKERTTAEETMVKRLLTLQNAEAKNASEKILAMIAKPITVTQTAIEGINKQLKELGYVDPVAESQDVKQEIGDPRAYVLSLINASYEPEANKELLVKMLEAQAKHPTIEKDDLADAINALQDTLGEDQPTQVSQSLDSLTIPQLSAMATDLGITIPNKSKKSTIIKLLEEATL